MFLYVLFQATKLVQIEDNTKQKSVFFVFIVEMQPNFNEVKATKS